MSLSFSSSKLSLFYLFSVVSFGFFSSLLSTEQPCEPAICERSLCWPQISGKFDIGPIYARVDILESHKTIKTLNMGGLKADSTLVFENLWGICLKSCFLYSEGDGRLFNAGVGLGQCIPLGQFHSLFKCFTLTPYFGCSWTYLVTKIDLPYLGKLKESFSSISPFAALELVVALASDWRICAQAQYAWSHTRTVIKHLPTNKSHPEGPAFAMMIEHDLTKRLSVNLGAAYNSSLTQEKHGIRGMGARLGVAFWW